MRYANVGLGAPDHIHRRAVCSNRVPTSFARQCLAAYSLTASFSSRVVGPARSRCGHSQQQKMKKNFLACFQSFSCEMRSRNGEPAGKLMCVRHFGTRCAVIVVPDFVWVIGFRKKFFCGEDNSLDQVMKRSMRPQHSESSARSGSAYRAVLR